MIQFRITAHRMIMICLIGQMCACATSSLVDVWRDPSFHATHLGNILVIAVQRDATKRRIWEDAFSSELAKRGVTAASSYSLYPVAAPDTLQVMAAVQENGFDGILAILRLSSETNAQFIRGYTSIEKVDRYSSYWHRYWTHYLEIEHPGYIDSQTIDIRTIDVTTTGQGARLIWSATSRTPDPSSVLDVQQEIAGLVISEMAKQRIIISINH